MRKSPTSRKNKARRPEGSRNSSHSEDPKRSKGKSRFSRKQLIIGLIAAVLVFDVGLVSFWFLGGGGNGPSVPPNPDPYALISSQMSNNKRIAEIGYDSTLTFANYPNLTIANASSLKPIENNLLKSGGAPGGGDALYDEQIVGRALRLNSDWVDHLNLSDSAVFASVQEGSNAQTKLAELGAGSLVAYHRLAIGEIRHTGKNYYIITRASYTLTRDGQLDIHDELFVYKLVAQGNTMVVVDFEQISPNTSAIQPQEEAPEEMADPSQEQPTGDPGVEGAEGGEGAEGDEGQGETPPDGSDATPEGDQSEQGGGDEPSEGI
ncbi:MAG: hypothetical protein LBK67_10295 [Coriobacteriales bacterium]|nr:hypothetical protein [Coriobacteriales bacterium]